MAALSPSSLDCSVQCKNVGLEGDRLDQPDRLSHFVGTMLDQLNGADGLRRQLQAALGLLLQVCTIQVNRRSVGNRLARLLDNATRHFGNFADAASLLVGSDGQFLGTLRERRPGRRHARRAVGHRRQKQVQTGVHGFY